MFELEIQKLNDQIIDAKQEIEWKQRDIAKKLDELTEKTQRIKELNEIITRKEAAIKKLQE